MTTITAEAEDLRAFQEFAALTRHRSIEFVLAAHARKRRKINDGKATRLVMLD